MARVRILTHGGSSSPAAAQDGTARAAEAALEAAAETSALEETVLIAMDVLEDDPRFNAGTGSSLRAGGERIQMDAAFMAWHSTVGSAPPTFGAVACLERVRHPTRVACTLSRQQSTVLCGAGAADFARHHGHSDYDPMTAHAQRRYAASLRGSDTVGCVATNGRGYAAALSSGGLTGAPLGRVGDVPLPGCGLFAGPQGAVAFTGIGEEIIRRTAAIRCYARLAAGDPAPEVLGEARAWFGDIEFGCILLGPGSYAAGSNREMAWTFLERIVS